MDACVLTERIGAGSGQWKHVQQQFKHRSNADSWPELDMMLEQG
jgi:hypothetical protein